ncbi:ATP-binding protein [Nostoc sphaeroides CHAB 2801]|uniref:AAA family ATPase n=1 Tax=Nostoc sphaeroides TaxID=446679 RepID=UPI001E497ACD|nr:ATP-binding protein [Nostoc sphaeroides]MCC5631509.1 ATP-binding protein [Nostoc sphaeroides CHAB 2801]
MIPFKFVEYIRQFIDSNGLDTEIRKANINISAELEEFGKIFISVAKQSTSAKFLIPPDETYPDWDLDVYPKEFKALMDDKNRLFCGRDFVFEAIRDFVEKEKKGYFTVIGDAGMGKSAIAAQYVLRYKCPCYFNVFTEGRNKPEKFLASIRQQLIKRYSLQNAETDNLQTLLQKTSEELKGQKLVIVVDALDEVKQKENSNLLDLPQILPDGIYFLLTRRPYNQKTKRLNLSPETHSDELDLRIHKYQILSQEDVKEYLQLFLENDKNDKNKLSNWLEERKIYDDIFIQEVVVKSENNFMYLRYVLPAIANGEYDDLKLSDFPKGLTDYYNSHWDRMKMKDKNKEIEVFVLFILMQSNTSPTCKIITEIIKKKEEFKEVEELEVERILAGWCEYLKEQKIEEEVCYSIFHASFLDFLRKKVELKENRKIFEDIKKNMNIFLYRNDEINKILNS